MWKTPHTQILNKIEKLPSHSILVSLDVISLYTDIPNTEGVKSCFQYLVKYRKRPCTPSNTSLALLLHLVLRLDNFQFNGKHYLQVGGTADKSGPLTSQNIHGYLWKQTSLHLWHTTIHVGEILRWHILHQDPQKTITRGLNKSSK